MRLWNALCLHACYHRWNPISLILRDAWVFDVWLLNGPEYPGWRAVWRRL